MELSADVVGADHLEVYCFLKIKFKKWNVEELLVEVGKY